ncbi:unnamed protein product [Pedinophyceae sp. YPF-701]|nr:unnamed protein product [Pedinophyceae sp. YPF-701]
MPRARAERLVEATGSSLSTERHEGVRHWTCWLPKRAAMAIKKCLARRPSAFEELIAKAPAVLDALPDETLRAVAATSRAALLSTLKHTRFALWPSSSPREGKPALLRGLERREVPVPGSVRLEYVTRNERGHLCDVVHVEFPADDGNTLASLGHGPRFHSSLDDVLDGLDQLMARSEALGAPLRLRGVYIRPAGPRARRGFAAPSSEKLVSLLERHSVQHLRALLVQGLDLSTDFWELVVLLPDATKLELLHLDEPIVRRHFCEQICDSLRGLRRLRKLCLQSAAQCLEDDDVRPVAKVMQLLKGSTSIEELCFRGFENPLPGDPQAIEEVLRSNTTLRTLELDSEGGLGKTVGCAGVGAAIGAALETNRTLTHLCLKTGNMLRGDDCESFFHGLGRNRTLEVLDIEHAALHGEALAGLGRAVAAGSGLKRVRVKYNWLDPGVCMFAQAVMDRSCIESLTLYACGIGNDGMRELAKAMKHGALGRTLRELKLGNNWSITGEGVAVLAEALHGNTTLRELYLSDCSARDRGAAALATALQQGCALKVLEVAYCGIRDDGAIALAGALRTNTTLRALEVDVNPIGRTAGAALADALGPGSALHELRIGGVTPWMWLDADPMDDSTAQAFVRAVRRGAAVRVFDCTFWDKVASEGTREALAALGCRRAPDPHKKVDVP